PWSGSHCVGRARPEFFSVVAANAEWFTRQARHVYLVLKAMQFQAAHFDGSYTFRQLVRLLGGNERSVIMRFVAEP
ncbi:MAG: hypothetical protein EBX87_02320, partial [Actinobacteria bacterium]|nr:hypothetical protein [Actinomycetota bacterium]